mgnify:CR=1 FL=1
MRRMENPMLKGMVQTTQVMRRERRGSNPESLGRDRIIGPSVKVPEG